MRRIESLADELHLFLSKACRLLSPDQVVEDAIGVRIGNAEVALVRLPFDQIGRRRLGHDFLRYPHMPGGRALCLAERSNSTIIRSRAMTLPSRWGSASPTCFR